MLNKKHMCRHINFVACIFIIILLFTACNNIPTGKQTSVPVNSSDQANNETTELDEAIEQIKSSYMGKIDYRVVEEYFQQIIFNTEKMDLYQKNPKQFISEIEAELDNKLRFITDGSLIAPKAPSSIDDGISQIKMEYETLIEQDILNEVLGYMMVDMKSSYDADPQIAYDFMRKSLDETYMTLPKSSNIR